MADIIRDPTADELSDFIPIATKKRKKRDAKEKFEDKIAEEEQKAIKSKLPFAAQPARLEFNDYYELEVKKNIRRNGYLVPEEIKPLEIDWEKYSNLDNFEVIDEGEREDEHLSRKNPGLNVLFKYIKYKFKGYSNTYTVMESRDTALARAKKEATPQTVVIKEVESKKK